jgi:hypothetical protein
MTVGANRREIWFISKLHTMLLLASVAARNDEAIAAIHPAIVNLLG